MKKIFALLLITAQLHAQRVPIADKTTGQSFTAAEFNIVKQAINNIPTVDIDMKQQYGIVADGATDNVTKLMLFRSDWAGKKVHINAYMPDGTVLSSNNRWGYGLYDVDFIALNRCKIASIYSGTDEKFQRAYWTGELWQTNTMTYTTATGITWTSNYKRFNTVQPGDTVLTMVTAADTAIYKPGSRVLINSGDQIGTGFPTGTRWNEWNVVKANNLGSGKISLVKAFVYLHDAALWDNPGGDIPSGKPRLTLLADTSYSFHTGFTNFTFGAPSGTSGSYGTWLVIGNDVVCKNCHFDGDVFPTMSEKITLLNCRAQGPNTVGAEFDKVVGRVYCEDCTWNIPVSNGTGIDEVYFKNNHFKESVLLCSKYITFDHCDFRANAKPDNGAPAISAAPAGVPIVSLKIINGCTFSRTTTNASASAIDIPALRSIVISGVSGTTIAVPYSGSFIDGATALKVYTITKGTVMYKSDGSKIGTVDSLYFDATQFSGSGAFMVAGNWEAPANGETWYWSPLLNYYDDNPKVVSSYSPSFVRYSDELIMRANKDAGGGRQTIKLNLGDFRIDGSDRVVNMGGWLNNIEVTVLKAYKGTDANCDLSITDSAYNVIGRFDLKTRGTRRISIERFVGKRGNDAGDSSYTDRFHRQLHIFLRGSSGNLSDQLKGKMPNISVIAQQVNQ